MISVLLFSVDSRVKSKERIFNGAAWSPVQRKKVSKRRADILEIPDIYCFNEWKGGKLHERKCLILATMLLLSNLVSRRCCSYDSSYINHSYNTIDNTTAKGTVSLKCFGFFRIGIGVKGDIFW